MELLPQLKAQLCLPLWNDRTRWSQLLSSPIKTEQHYIERALRAPIDVVSRAAAASSVVRGVEGPLSKAVAPFRVGPVATDSIEVFHQLLHAALAGHHAAQMLSGADVSAAMVSSGAAWRHLAAAGPWAHEEHLCPPQLALPFRRALELAVLLLTYERLATAPLAVCDEARHRRRIELLQAAVACNGPTCIRRWAMPLLATTVAEYWARYHRDPRAPDSKPSERHACAIIRAIGDTGSQKAEAFVQMHQTVHGYVTSGEACDPDRLLLSAVPAATIIQAALPHEALEGPATLPGVRTFQQVGMISAGEGAQPIVASGGVVMIAKDADRCNVQPTKFSLRMPRLWPVISEPAAVPTAVAPAGSGAGLSFSL